MKLIKKMKVLIFAFFILSFFVSSPKQYTNQVNRLVFYDAPKSTEYHDWSEAADIDPEYSFSTLYLTEKTEFQFIKNDGEIEWKTTQEGKEVPWIKRVKENNELLMLITNCAVNKNGEVLDVLIHIDSVKPYTEEGYVELYVMSDIFVLDSQNYPADLQTRYLGFGDPMTFELFTSVAACDFTMTYYKTGTYNPATNQGVLGNINLVNGYFYDIDVPNLTGSYQDELFEGNEGLRPNVGSSEIYYNKNQKNPLDPNFHEAILQEIDNGIAIKTTKSNTNGIWYGNGALMLTKGISNSRYSFTYGGTGCGIFYFFASPYPYDITPPSKKADTTEVTPGDSFTYEISQYIPNNYYANLFKFHEIYKNLQSDTELKKFTLKDTFSNVLEVKENDIRITTETEKDVTELFQIEISNNDLLVTAKPDTYHDSTFYNHTYIVHVPVTLKENTSQIKGITNVSFATTKIGNQPEKILSTNEVNLPIKYRLIVNYLKEGTTDKIVESDILYYDLEEKYKTSPNKVTGMWGLVGHPKNASGTITENIEVNYYFKELINPDTGMGIGKMLFIIIFVAFFIFYLVKIHKRFYKL